MKQKYLIQFAALTLCLALTVLSPAYAATPTTPEGADKLKAILTRYLDYQKTFASTEGQGLLKLDGEIIVEPQDTYYAVTLPHAKIDYIDGGRLEIGIISINASEADEPNRWKMSVAIPTPMIAFDKDSNQIARIAIGGQRFAGIWDDEMESFIKLDAAYKDIAVESANPAHTISIPETQIRFDFSENDKGLWSGPGFIALKNINAEMPTADTTLKLGEVKAEFMMKDYNPSVIKTYREQMMALADSSKDADPAQAPNPQEALGLYNMMMDLFFNSGDGFTSQYSFTDLHHKYAGRETTVKTGFFGFDMTGFLQDKVKMALRGGYSGLAMTPLPPGYADVQPSDINVDLTLDNLPFKEIAEIGKNTLASAIDNPQGAQLAGLTLMLKLPAILGQSGTYMTIKDNRIANNQYSFNLNGTARADISAVNSVTAEVKGVFAGLERLISSTQALASAQQADGTPKTGVEAENSLKFRNLGETLTKLKQIAKIETGTTGEAAHVFDLVMNAEGKILLNDQDLMTLLNAPVATPAAVPSDTATQAEPPATP